MVKEAGYQFDVCYTSYLKRAFMTSSFALEHSDQLHVPELIRRPAALLGAQRPAARARVDQEAGYQFDVCYTSYLKRAFKASSFAFAVRPDEGARHHR